MRESEKRARFERLVLPHLDAAYNLAVWLMRDDALAEEAVQESCLRAFRYFDSLRGDDARPIRQGRSLERDGVSHRAGMLHAALDAAIATH